MVQWINKCIYNGGYAGELVDLFFSCKSVAKAENYALLFGINGWYKRSGRRSGLESN